MPAGGHSSRVTADLFKLLKIAEHLHFIAWGPQGFKEMNGLELLKSSWEQHFIAPSLGWQGNVRIRYWAHDLQVVSLMGSLIRRA